MSRIRAISILVAMILCTSLFVYSSDFYEWTDENGVKHFADAPDEIPAKYRNQAKLPKPEQTPKRTVSKGPIAANVAATAEEQEPLGKFEVSYEALEGSAKRVIIPVTLNDAVTVPMALDTGSPGMIVSFELAERLGIFSHDGGTLVVAAAGIGGTTPAVLTVIDTVSIEGARSAFVPTTVTESMSPAFQGLIGMDFLSGYEVSIDSKRKVVVFQENPASQDAPGGHDEDWWRAIFERFRSQRDFWKQYAEAAGPNLASRRKAGVDFQVRESERLLQRLSIYASDHAVPLHWR